MRPSLVETALLLALLQVPVPGHLDAEVDPGGALPLARLGVHRLVGALEGLAAQGLAGVALLDQLGRFDALGLFKG